MGVIFMQKKIIFSIGFGYLAALALHAATSSDAKAMANGQALTTATPVATAISCPLHGACQASSIDQLNAAIKTLSGNGTLAGHIDDQDSEGNTALHLAAKQDNAALRLAMVQALLGAGASIKILNTTDGLAMDFITDQNAPCADLLKVSNEDRQQLVMDARNREIAAANTVNEASISNNNIETVVEDKPDLD